MQLILITLDMHLRTDVNKLLAKQVITCKNKESFMKIKSNANDEIFTVIIDDKFPDSYEIACFIMSNNPETRIIYLVSKKMISQSFISQGNLFFSQKPISKALINLIHREIPVTKFEKESDEIKLIGNSEPIKRINSLIKTLADSNLNIFIYGETGTGKEILAKAIHKARYPNSEMISESCSFLNSGTSDSELFGHSKGAFTGAIENHTGLVELADNSTLFLDEIEDLSINGQSKLLRLFETGEYRKVGDSKIKHSKFSLITATNIKIEDLLASKQLRNDFFHRISTIIITIPPLRERIEDIPVLTSYYEKKKGYSKSITSLENLYNYSWPGNVRELFATIDRIHCIDPSHLLPTKELIENTNYIK